MTSGRLRYDRRLLSLALIFPLSDDVAKLSLNHVYHFNPNNRPDTRERLTPASLPHPLGSPAGPSNDKPSSVASPKSGVPSAFHVTLFAAVKRVPSQAPDSTLVAWYTFQVSEPSGLMKNLDNPCVSRSSCFCIRVTIIYAPIMACAEVSVGRTKDRPRLVPAGGG